MIYVCEPCQVACFCDQNWIEMSNVYPVCATCAAEMVPEDET